MVRKFFIPADEGKQKYKLEMRLNCIILHVKEKDSEGDYFTKEIYFYEEE